MIRLSAFADEISPDPVQQLDVLERHGIKHVEFRSIHGTNVMDLSEAQHAEFRDLLHARGFALSAIGSPIGKIKIGDPFEPHLERFARALDLADFYATPRIRVFSYYIPDGTSRMDVRGEVVRRLTAQAQIAEDRGVALFLENEKGSTANRAPGPRPSRLGRHPQPGQRFRPGQLPRSRPTDHRGVGNAPAQGPPFPRQGLRPGDPQECLRWPGSGPDPELIADAVAHGYSGFCTLEPHLMVAEKMYGFTGPERFGDAAEALKSALLARKVAFA